MAVPNRAKNKMMAVAMPMALNDIAIRSARLKRGQKVANSTAASTGPMVAKNVANARNAVPSIFFTPKV